MTATAAHPTAGFGPASTAAEVIDGIDLAGTVAIVTGGYSGIGLETVRVLREAGAELIVPARDMERARAGLRGVDGVEIAPMDLLDAESIDAFAGAFLVSGRPLHLLVNNGGIMATPFARDKRGFESQLAVNHLGHFQLTTRLWPAFVAAGGARVITLSSRGHRFSPFVFDDPHFEHREYEPFAAYGQSKTANTLFTVELDRRGRGEGIRAVAAHPGLIIDTGLVRHIDPAAIRATGVIGQDGQPVRDPVQQLKTVAQGAATTVWCATSPLFAEHGGVYCENCDVSPLVRPEEEAAWRTSNGIPGVLPYAMDPDAAARLWELSERLIAR